MTAKEKMEALKTIFVVCVLRWGKDQDVRFGLAALVTYQVLMGPLKKAAIEEARKTLQGLKKALIDRNYEEGNLEAVQKNVVVFAHANSLIEGLEGRRDGFFASFGTKKQLAAVAPDLLRGIETYDVGIAST